MTDQVKLLIGIGLATVLILVVGVAVVSKTTTNSNAPAKPVDSSLLIRSDSNKMAGATSKVTVVEFGDYQCPACGAVHPLVKQVVDANKDNLTFVFRNFPLSQHANAQIAAEAAEAAGAQGKYWEMHDKLYSSQADWSDSKNPLDLFVGYAKDLGLDTTKLKQEVSDKKYSAKITADSDDGNRLGVDATPTFYIDGVKFSGDYSNFKSQIEIKIKGG